MSDLNTARLGSTSKVNWVKDLTAGLVVFLVALPLCLGIALASGADLQSGLLAGIIGGIVVGSLSGSHTSVSGPAAGLAAIVLAQISALGSFQTFLLAVFLAGILQIAMGIAKAGALSAFFPSSVIKGLLAAIGVLLILKQIPHVLGHDKDPEGEMSFSQPDQENTFTEIGSLFVGEVHLGAALVGILSVLLLVGWQQVKRLKNSIVPAPLVVVVLGVGLKLLFDRWGGSFQISTDHLVQIPVANSLAEMSKFFAFPDFSQWANPGVYFAAITIAIVASLETLLNLDAVDNIDPRQRDSPPSRELVAQGVGNMVAGLVGAIPITSVIVRSSVNVNAGACSKVSAIFHGILLLICVALLPALLNEIPLAALAAVLLVTGFKLASPSLFRQMWSEGRYQFLPFLITLVSIVFTDLLIGILIGLGVSVLFILNSNLRRPIRRIVETHLGGDILRVELANQVSFLNRAALFKVIHGAPSGSHLLIDATDTDYIDPDVLSLIREYKEKTAPQRDVTVSLQGFRSKYQLQDDIQFADHSTRELLDRVTPQQVLEILREGNRRFRTGHRISRDFQRQLNATAREQNPLAAILSCIDSRVPAELVFDLGLGDIFSVRVAGNVVGTKSLASIEYGVVATGMKLVLVLGHTRCGAVTSSVDLLSRRLDVTQATGSTHLGSIVSEIQQSLKPEELDRFNSLDPQQKESLINQVAARNVLRTVQEILDRSELIRNATSVGRVMVVGALYDVVSGAIEFFADGEETDTSSG